MLFSAALLTGSLVGGCLSTLAPAAPALAAAQGGFTIGATPVELNQATDPEAGVLTPAADAAEKGMYGSVIPFPVLPMHATLTRDGHLVTFGTPVDTVAQSGIAFDTWNIAAGLGRDAHSQDAAEHGYDSFCNAAVTMLDGRILMVSGQMWADHDASMMSMIYDPYNRTQTMGADLAYKRWYVTALRLTDGRILLLGGAKAGHTAAYQNPDDNSDVATVPEIGTGTGPWTDLAGAASTELFGAADNRWWYPRAFNGPNGTVVGTSGDRIWSLDPAGNGSVQQTGTLPYNPKVSGSQVMFAPGRILIAGGGQVNNDDPVTASNDAVVLDVNGGAPRAQFTQPMAHPRNWLNLTVLPTGGVFANGGTIVGTNGGDDNSVRQAEVWNPGSGTWSTAATAQMTRTYHSTALLLPSGAVFTGGSGNPGPVDNFNGELYYPASLFTKGADGTVSWASRPAITSIAGNGTYGGTVQLKIGDGRQIASASLITMPSVTHSENTDQRRIPLAISQQGDVVNATLPGSVNTMPPGGYQLTVVDENGVPSTSQIITIQQGQPGLVSVAGGPQNPTSAVAAPTGPATGDTGTGAQPAPVDPGKPVAPVAPAPVHGTKALQKGTSIGLESMARNGFLASASGTKVTMVKAGSKSAPTAKRKASWIVRTGLGSKHGYSFESVSRKGYYLTAPSSGSGALVLAKMSKSSAFAKRATFAVVKGAMGHDTSLRLAAKPTKYLKVSGSRLLVGGLGESSAAARAATFELAAGLAKRG